jgi:hypothetical protein
MNVRRGIRYPADPPTVDEIGAVMRHTADYRHHHGWRLRAIIVAQWCARLRVQEALAPAENDSHHAATGCVEKQHSETALLLIREAP